MAQGPAQRGRAEPLILTEGTIPERSLGEVFIFSEFKNKEIQYNNC